MRMVAMMTEHSLKAGLKITCITFMGPPWRVEWGASSRALVKAFGGAEPIGLLGELMLPPLQWGKVAPRLTIQRPPLPMTHTSAGVTIQLQYEQRLNPNTSCQPLAAIGWLPWAGFLDQTKR